MLSVLKCMQITVYLFECLNPSLLYIWKETSEEMKIAICNDASQKSLWQMVNELWNGRS